MVIKKKYHFYAAHRNEYLVNSLCYNLHGHVYRFWVYVEERMQANGTTILFNDIDKKVKQIIDLLDHSTLVHKKDEKLLAALEILGTKKVIMTKPTSAEYLAAFIFKNLELSGLPIVRLDLMETESSTVIYEK